MNGFLSLLWGFLSIAVMVFVHESGHFLAAKTVGIEVEVFAVGWGKALKKWKKGSTEYRINIFPLGGYCRLKGAKDLEKALKSETNQFDAIEEGSLFKVSPLKRIITYLCGPLANILFAIILFIPYLMIGYDAQVDPNRIAVTSDYKELFILEDNYIAPAAKSGLATGDYIIAIDGIETQDFQHIQELLGVQETTHQTVFTVERGDEVFDVAVQPDYNEEERRPVFGVTSFVEPVIESVQPLSPEATAGLRPKDRIVRVQHIQVHNTLDISKVLSDDPSRIVLSVLREGLDTPIDIAFHPDRSDDGSMMLQFSIARQFVHRDGEPFMRAVTSAVKEAFSTMWQTYAAIPMILAGSFNLNDVLAGPLRISYIIGDMTSAGMSMGFASGMRTLLWLMAIVSVSLAAANLLPLPALDGGLILMSVVELVRGRSVRPRTYARLQNFGAIIIILLFIIALIGDVRFFL